MWWFQCRALDIQTYLSYLTGGRRRAHRAPRLLTRWWGEMPPSLCFQMSRSLLKTDLSLSVVVVVVVWGTTLTDYIIPLS